MSALFLADEHIFQLNGAVYYVIQAVKLVTVQFVHT